MPQAKRYWNSSPIEAGDRSRSEVPFHNTASVVQGKRLLAMPNFGTKTGGWQRALTPIVLSGNGHAYHLASPGFTALPRTSVGSGCGSHPPPPISKQVAVLVHLPRADGEVIFVPLPGLVVDKLLPQFLAEGFLHQGVGGEGFHRVQQVLGQEFDAPVRPLCVAEFVEVVLLGFARVDLVFDAVEAGGEGQGCGEIGIYGAVRIAGFAAAAAHGHPHAVGAVVGAVGVEHRRPGEIGHGALAHQALVAVDRGGEHRAQGLAVLEDAADKVVAGFGEAEAPGVVFGVAGKDIGAGGQVV